MTKTNRVKKKLTDKVFSKDGPHVFAGFFDDIGPDTEYFENDGPFANVDHAHLAKAILDGHDLDQRDRDFFQWLILRGVTRLGEDWTQLGWQVRAAGVELENLVRGYPAADWSLAGYIAAVVGTGCTADCTCPMDPGHNLLRAIEVYNDTPVLTVAGEIVASVLPEDMTPAEGIRCPQHGCGQPAALAGGYCIEHSADRIEWMRTHVNQRCSVDGCDDMIALTRFYLGYLTWDVDRLGPLPTTRCPYHAVEAYNAANAEPAVRSCRMADCTEPVDPNAGPDADTLCEMHATRRAAVLAHLDNAEGTPWISARSTPNSN